MTSLTDAQQTELLRAYNADANGGLVVPYVSRVHKALADAGLVEIIRQPDGSGARIKCTVEGRADARMNQ